MRRVDVARGPGTCDLGFEGAAVALGGAVGEGFALATFDGGRSGIAAGRARTLRALDGVYEDVVAAVGRVGVVGGHAGSAGGERS